jgi:hypothetical protein
VQVGSIKPTLKAPGIERSKLNHDQPVSNFAFKYNLHIYRVGVERQQQARAPNQRLVRRRSVLGATVHGRGFLSSTSRLNLSRLCYSNHSMYMGIETTLCSRKSEEQTGAFIAPCLDVIFVLLIMFHERCSLQAETWTWKTLVHG